jgi:hypothetical protein
MAKKQRDIRQIIESIKQAKFEEVINSDLAVNLLYAWSQLFNYGQQPSWCAKCMRRYYTELINNGLDMVSKFEESQNRTCVPKWLGDKYIHRAGRHYNNFYLTDKEAIELLNKGLISEDQFEKLPDGYVSKQIVIEQPKELILEVEEKKFNLAKSKKAKK